MSESYNPEGNARGAAEATIQPDLRGLPDQFQGRYNHVISASISRLVPLDFFPLRRIKENANLDKQFELRLATHPEVVDLLKRLALEQAATGTKRGNFKLVWNAARTILFGMRAEAAAAEKLNAQE